MDQPITRLSSQSSHYLTQRCFLKKHIPVGLVPPTACSSRLTVIAAIVPPPPLPSSTIATQTQWRSQGWAQGARAPPFALVGVYHEWQGPAGNNCIGLLPGGLDRCGTAMLLRCFACASANDKTDPTHFCTRTRTSGKRSNGKIIKHPPSGNPGYAPETMPVPPSSLISTSSEATVKATAAHYTQSQWQSAMSRYHILGCP